MRRKRARHLQFSCVRKGRRKGVKFSAAMPRKKVGRDRVHHEAGPCRGPVHCLLFQLPTSSADLLSSGACSDMTGRKVLESGARSLSLGEPPCRPIKLIRSVIVGSAEPKPAPTAEQLGRLTAGRRMRYRAIVTGSAYPPAWLVPYVPAPPPTAHRYIISSWFVAGVLASVTRSLPQVLAWLLQLS